MSGYAITAAGSWRLVNSALDLAPGETYSTAEPAARPSAAHSWDGAAWALTLASYQAAKSAEIERETGRRINALYPLATGVQNNMQKRTAQILRKRIMAQPLSQAEIDEETALLAIGNWIDAVRDAGRACRTAIAAAASLAAVDAAVAGVAWPTITPPEWQI